MLPFFHKKKITYSRYTVIKMTNSNIVSYETCLAYGSWTLPKNLFTNRIFSQWNCLCIHVDMTPLYTNLYRQGVAHDIYGVLMQFCGLQTSKCGLHNHLGVAKEMEHGILSKNLFILLYAQNIVGKVLFDWVKPTRQIHFLHPIPSHVSWISLGYPMHGPIELCIFFALYHPMSILYTWSSQKLSH